MQTSPYSYDTARRKWKHGIVMPPILAALRTLPEDAALLDVGCGNGALLSELGRYGRWRLCGVETSATGVEIARNQGIDARLADGRKDLSGLFEQMFDLVISIEVIEHIYDSAGFLDAAYRVLRPGGKMVISTPYHGYLKNLLLAAMNKCDTHYDPRNEHIRFWSRQTLTAAMREAGFRDFEFNGAGRLPWLWKSMVITAVR
jgi:2-polyprenyl-3-methyl-5-hydroxy-6-metoxy-1,4-benzoquinol methylase